MAYYAIEPPTPWANIEGKPYITVSAKGIANGLSDIPNDGADFGPDTPGTQTSGIQEAVNYAYANAVSVYVDGDTIPSLLTPTIKLSTGYFDINAGIYLPAPGNVAFGPNWHIQGAGLQNTVLNFNFNDTPGFTISTDNYYGMFVFEGFSPNANPGYTPGGWLNANFIGTSNASHDNIVIRDVNVYPSSWQGNSMVLTGLIQAVLINYWDTTKLTSSNPYNGPLLGNTVTKWLGGSSYSLCVLNNNYLFEADSLSTIKARIITGNGSYIFRNSNDVTISIAMASASPVNYIELNNVIIDSSGATISAGTSGTIQTLRIKNLTYDGTASGSLVGSNINVIDFRNDGGFQNVTSYTYTLPTIPGFSVTTPAVPASGTAQTNNNPFPVRIYILTVGDATALSITDPGGTTVNLGAPFAGQEITLDPGASITITYSNTAPTWKWYGV